MSATSRIVAPTFACILFAGGSPSPGSQRPRSEPEIAVGVSAEAIERGRRLTAAACASCHATGASGDSPLPDATPFRGIVRRYPLDQLEAAFAEGLVTSHPVMPGYAFRASEIDDLISYLETLKADQ